MQARLRDAERLADRAQAHLDKAEKAMAALEPKDMASALEDAKETLGEKDIELYPDAQLHIDKLKELEGQLPRVKAEREKRDLDRRLNAARDKIVPRVQALLEAIEANVPSAPSRDVIRKLESKAKSVKEAVDDDLDLFAKDADFAAWAKSQLSKAEKGLDGVVHAKKGLAFVEGPVAAWKEALSLQSEAKAEKSPVDKASTLKKARIAFSICERESQPFAADKLTSSVAFVMPTGKPQNPTQLRATCQKALKSTDTELKKLSVAVKKLKK